LRLARALLSVPDLFDISHQEKAMKLVRSFIFFSALWGALAGCSKHNDENPAAEASSGGEDNTAQKAGHDVDEAADEAGDEVQHIGNDRDEKVDEAQDKVDEATGAD
jgi:hypothetical protein